MFDEHKLLVLEDEFDPSNLPPGYYTAYSDTAAYPALWGMTKTGWARNEGERYLEGGVVQLVASHEMPPLTENPEDAFEEAMVVIPHSSFTKVVNDYGDWRQMWWREVIQNAIDAGADSIDCRLKEQPDGTWLVSCQDNGSGMDYDTLMNAFFTVGGTEKRGYAHGGFGEAKKLIALAWISYAIHTRDIKVTGSGAEFPRLKLYRDQPPIDGTLVEVVMPADRHTTEAAAVEYISRCQLPGVKFFVNGKPVKALLRRGRKKRDLPQGAELFYNKDIKALHAVLVRSNGLYMFSQMLSTDFNGVIVVEVHPQPKSEGGPTVEDLFLSNRMELQYGALRDAVSKVYTQAEFDVKQALRAPDALFRRRYKGRGYFTTETAANREAMVRQAAGPLPESNTSGGLEMTGEMKGELVTVLAGFKQQTLNEAGGDAARLVSVVSAEEADVMLGMSFKGESHLEAGIQQLVWQPDFMNMNDETTRAGFRLDRKFEPEHMTGAIYALARVWAAFVRLILVKKGSRSTWGVGFVFSTEAQGMYHVAAEDGSRWVVLNPINLATGKLMSIRNKADVRKIFDTAMHECAHLLGGAYHGDGFVQAYDSIVTELLEHWNEAKRIARHIKVRGVVKKRTGDAQVPEETAISIMPLTEDLAVVMVRDEPSITVLRTELSLDDRPIQFFLEGERLSDLLWSIPDEQRKEWDSGAGFTLLRSYPWVRREVLRETQDDAGEAPADVLPVRVFVTADGSLYLEPASGKQRRYYGKYFRDISEASTRVLVAHEADAEQVLRRMFFDSYQLSEWPYPEGGQRPEDFIHDLYEQGQVLIPIERSIYHRALSNAATYEPETVVRERSLLLNVTQDSDSGTYAVHPSGARLYRFYQQRFDAPWAAFDVVLTGQREIEQLEGAFDARNENELQAGFATGVKVPTKLLEQWLYTYEHELRNPKRPELPESIAALVTDTVVVIARNLGTNIFLLEFSSPSERGLKIAQGLGVGISDLAWFLPADAAYDAVISGHPEEALLEKFWKQCAPGYMQFAIPARLFETGMDWLYGSEQPLEPIGSIPVWLVAEDDGLMIRPVLERHKRWLEDVARLPGELLLGVDEGDRQARMILGETFNCGRTSAGLDTARHMQHNLASGRPVLAVVTVSRFMQLATGD